MRRKRAPEYVSWQHMKRRCFNPQEVSYARYGGIGITVCERWKNSFMTFLADMGPMPTPKHTIDRIDNTKGYEPGNCRWATVTEQNRNKRTTKLSMKDVDDIRALIAAGAKQRELARRYGVDTSTISNIFRRKYWHSDETRQAEA